MNHDGESLTNDLTTPADSPGRDASGATNVPGPLAAKWVPVDAIVSRPDVNPRRSHACDPATVKRYAEQIDRLPPISVQRDTLVLIDGRHRLEAAKRAGLELISVEELGLADDELIDHAVHANVGHGRPASAADRRYWAEDFLRRHRDWSPSRIAEWTGASESAVKAYSRPARAAGPEVRDAGQAEQVVQIIPPGTILGRDRRRYPARTPVGAAVSRALRATTLGCEAGEVRRG